MLQNSYLGKNTEQCSLLFDCAAEGRADDTG